MVNKNVAQKAVVAALSGMMALAPAAPALAVSFNNYYGFNDYYDTHVLYSILKSLPGSKLENLLKGDKWTRLSGDDRYETNQDAIDYAYSYRIKSDTYGLDLLARQAVKTAIVVSGDNWPDALAASGLAGAESVVTYGGDIWESVFYDTADSAAWYNALGTTVSNNGWRTWGTTPVYDNNGDLDYYKFISDYREGYDPDGIGSGKVIPAPIVLTKKDALTKQAKETLEDLGVEKVIVLGGTATISDDVVSQLKNEGYDVDRVAGKDRAATSVEALKYIAQHYNTLNGIVVATGNTYADALSIAPVAIKCGYGVVFTQADGTLSQEAVDAIKAVTGRYGATWNKKNLIIVGGEKSVSNTVVGQLADNGMSFHRIDGENRYLTSVKIANEFFRGYSDGFEYDIELPYGTDSSAVITMEYLDGMLDGAVVANGEDYPDALTAGPLAALYDVPVILVSDNSNAGIKFLENNLGLYYGEYSIGNATFHLNDNNLIIGGEKSVSKATKDKLEDIDNVRTYFADLFDLAAFLA